MSVYIAWKDYYSVGDESIDAQHKRILSYINELYTAMQQGMDRKAIKPILDRMAQYAVDHFLHEEEVMRLHDYPDAVRHKAQHDKMRQQTLALRDNADLMTGRDLLVFLKDWWCNHIQEEDKKYAPFLRSLVEV